MIDIDYVRARIDNACATLKQLPMAVNDRPAPVRAIWPATVQEFHQAYGYAGEREPRLQPARRAVSEMDKVLQWLLLIEDGRTRQVVFARGLGVAERVLAQRFGCTRETIRRRRRKGLEKITERLTCQVFIQM